MKDAQIKKLFDYEFQSWMKTGYMYFGNSTSTAAPIYNGSNAQLSFGGASFNYPISSVGYNLKSFLKEKGDEYSLQDLQVVLQYTQDETEKKVIQDYIKPRLINLWSEE